MCRGTVEESRETDHDPLRFQVKILLTFCCTRQEPSSDRKFPVTRQSPSVLVPEAEVVMQYEILHRFREKACVPGELVLVNPAAGRVIIVAVLSR